MPRDTPRAGQPVPLVRVRIGTETGPCRLGAGQGFVLPDLQQEITGSLITAAPENGEVAISDTLGNILFKGPGPVRLEAREKGQVRFGSREYGGAIRLLCRQDTMVIINILDMENYLKGVLPLEMGDRTEDEYASLLAQAVAARTYALFQLNKTGATPLASDEMDQVYGGSGVWKENASRAVDQTRGEVLVCNDSLIKANYSSTCGGRTELPENVWPDRRSGCFVSVEDTFCAVSRHYQWQELWPAAEMERLLKKYIPLAVKDTVDTAFKLQDIRVLNRLTSGRADTLEIVTDKGVYRFSRDPLRWVLRRPHEREPILRSSFIEVEVLRGQDGTIDTVKVNGRGNGHGVGMCQWGAIGRARAGHSYEAILDHFYPRARKKKLY